MRSRHGEELGRFVRFGLVGGSNTAVTLTVYWALIQVGVAYAVAAAVGYAAALLNGYTWNRLWTFESGPFHAPEFMRYLLVSTAGLILNLAGLALAVETFDLPRFLAEVVALVPVVILTYSLNRNWAFRARPSH